MFGSDYKPLGSAVPPRAFGPIFIILGSFSVLLQFWPGHTPEASELGLAFLWIGLGILHFFGDRKQRELLAAGAGGVWVAEAKGLLAAGDKTAAINVVRQATRLTLVQATQVVESWEEK